MDARSVPPGSDWDWLGWIGLLLAAMAVAAMVGCNSEGWDAELPVRVVLLPAYPTYLQEEEKSEHNDWGCKGWLPFAVVQVNEDDYTILWEIDDHDVPAIKICQMALHYPPGTKLTLFRPDGPYWVPERFPTKDHWRIDTSDTTLKVLVAKEPNP